MPLALTKLAHYKLHGRFTSLLVESSAPAAAAAVVLFELNLTATGSTKMSFSEREREKKREGGKVKKEESVLGLAN